VLILIITGVLSTLGAVGLRAAPTGDGPPAAAAMAIQASDIDFAATKGFVNGAPAKDLPPEAIEGLLGMEDGRQGATWSLGDAPGKATTFQYLLVLKTPVEVGSLLLAASGPMKASCLKAGAAVPARPDASADWAPVEFPPGQSGGQMATFDKGFKTQAILLTDAREHGRSEIACLRLEDATAGQEHFNGYFCKTADNRYYVVAGHNHASIVEVVGLDKFKRLQGEIQVTPDDVKQAEAWEHRKQKRRSYEAARVVDGRPRGEIQVKVDGDDREWPAAAGASIDLNPTSSQDDRNLLFRMLVDDTTLYVCYSIRGHGPMKNTGNEWHTYYKTGACVDLQIGADPKADPMRKDPVEGDLRLLMTVVGGQPQAVLYRPVAPGAPKDLAWQTGTMVWRTSFDRVEKLSDARMACQGGADGYVFEAAIPLATLGLKPQSGQRYKLDWGILESGKDGNEVLQRIYWANKATSIIADVAAEAMLHPDLWGFVRFGGQAGGPELVDPEKFLKREKGEKSIEELLKD